MSAKDTGGAAGGKALAAVIRYEIAAAKVAADRKAISDAIGKCPVNAEMESGWGKPGFDEKKFMDGSRIRTHLHETLKETVPCDSGYGYRRQEDEEVTEALEESGCAHCLTAWLLVLQRREARKEFGIAKRAIRSIGRAMLAARKEAT
jgi:hypothetical protein